MDTGLQSRQIQPDLQAMGYTVQLWVQSSWLQFSPDDIPATVATTTQACAAALWSVLLGCRYSCTGRGSG